MSAIRVDRRVSGREIGGSTVNPNAGYGLSCPALRSQVRVYIV